MKTFNPASTIVILVISALLVVFLVEVAVAEVKRCSFGRSKVGLVLSGGGARGAAHIGVLRVLEEQRVPVDYIVGTSIGAAVGGLYAMGLSPDEIEETLASIDWEDVFKDLPPRNFRSYRRKTDDYRFQIKFKPGFKNGKLIFPRGLIQGQKLDLALSAATLPVAGINDFDRLPIPFRAVAAEVGTGREVVLESGNLGRAIQASMAIPVIFSPIVIDGQSLVDGGIVNNLPVNVIQAMGADIIIAVDIGTPLQKAEELTSVVRIGAQLSGFLTRKGTDAQIALLGENDLLLIPDLTGFRTADFVKFREIIPIGRKAAEGNLKTIQQWSLSEENYRSYRESISRHTTPLPVINFVDVENHSQVADNVILSRLGDFHLGAPLDMPSLEKKIANAYGLELFQNIRYQVVEKDGMTGLKIEIEERSWGPNYIQFGLDYNSNAEGNSVFGVSVGFLKTAMNSAAGEWRTILTLGEEPAVEIDLYQPLGAGSAYFINPMLRVGQQLTSAYSEGNIVTEFRVREAFAELASGRIFGSWGEARFGLRFATGKNEVRVGDPTILVFDSKRSEAFIRLSADMVDNVSFPTSGSAANVEWLASREALGADSDFDQIHINGLTVTSRNRNSLLVRARYGVTSNGIAPIQSSFQFGGFQDLSGLNEDELSGQNVARVGFTVFHRGAKTGMLNGYLGLSMEVGNVWAKRKNMSLKRSIWGGSVWIGAKTMFGPIFVGYGWAEKGRNAVYFMLGHSLI